MDEMGTAKPANESTPEQDQPQTPQRHWERGRWCDENGLQILPEGYWDRLAQEMCDNLRTHAADPDYEKKKFAKSMEDSKGWTI